MTRGKQPLLADFEGSLWRQVIENYQGQREHLDDLLTTTHMLRKATTPAEIHLLLQQTEPYFGQSLKELLNEDTVEELLELASDSEPTLNDFQKQLLANNYGPFCHGTSETALEDIQRSGLLPRCEMNGGCNWEEDSTLLSHLDRVYVGINTNPGIQKCVDSARNAVREQEVIEKPILLILNSEIALDDPVADEDCVEKEKELPNALKSADDCHSFAVRQAIPPNQIVAAIPLPADSQDDHSLVAKLICKAIFKADDWDAEPEEVEGCTANLKKLLESEIITY